MKLSELLSEAIAPHSGKWYVYSFKYDTWGEAHDTKEEAEATYNSLFKEFDTDGKKYFIGTGAQLRQVMKKNNSSYKFNDGGMGSLIDPDDDSLEMKELAAKLARRKAK